MKKILNYIAISLILILGSIHIILTPLFHAAFDLNAVWFAGAGLAFVFLGIINICRLKSTDHVIRKLCFISNLIAVIFCIFIVIKLAQPHAFISLIDLLLLSVLSFFDLKKKDKGAIEQSS